MKKKLYNGAVLHHPKDGDTVLIYTKLAFLAADQESAKIDLTRALGPDSPYASDELEVIVRPF